MSTLTNLTNHLPTTLALNDQASVAVPLGIASIVFLTIVMTSIMKTVRRTTETKQREQSRREIAAYVAEGTITPDDAVRMMAAGTPPSEFERGRRG